jgi:DNA-binding CsgD family transcriptional regulator
MMRDSAFIRENWRTIDWGGPGIQASVWLHLITEYSYLIKDEGFYASQSRLLQNLLNEIDTTQGELDTASELSDLLRDYKKLWPDDLTGLVTFWKELDDLKNQFNSTLTETPIIHDVTAFQRNALLIANAIACFILLVLIIQKPKTSQADDHFFNEQLLVLRDWPNNSQRVKQHVAMLDSLSAFIPSGFAEFHMPEGIDLSESEWMVFQSAAAGERPKELAIRKNLSPSYVYALRSSIRKKLGISEVEKLESWIELNKTSD